MKPILLLLLASPLAFSATIVEYNGANTSTDSIFVGQSLTTPGTGPWNTLTFNLYDINDAPSANGTLYLLTQAYLGAPSALSAATPGYVASTSTINGGIWSFAPGVSINSNTQYFFYTDSINNILRANTTGTYPDGIAYFSIGINTAFSADSSSDTLFNLSGTAGESPVPEPGQALLLTACLSLLVALQQKPAKQSRDGAG